MRKKEKVILLKILGYPPCFGNWDCLLKSSKHKEWSSRICDKRDECEKAAESLSFSLRQKMIRKNLDYFDVI